MIDWNPQLYLKYKDERTQPSIDLVSKIKIENPKSIIDIGCGPGNSSQALVKKWPQSKVTGMDNSPAMIEQAKKDYPDQTWLLRDAVNLDLERKYDLVFSNAVIQWIPNHNKVIPSLFSIVNKNGALAVQVPDFKTMPVNVAIEKVAASSKWSSYTDGCEELLTCHNADYYYIILSSLNAHFEMWETIYFHELESHEALIEWFRSTAMKPYLNKLPREDKKIAFENDVLEECKKSYPVQFNKKIILPFSRLFFVVYK
jgi:trans-aconitate 2-methyltransferase